MNRLFKNKGHWRRLFTFPCHRGNTMGSEKSVKAYEEY